MPKITWILVNCNTDKEAKEIGKKILQERLISCFDVWPRLYAAYFWPPRTGKIESSKGATLILETLSQKVDKINKIIRKMHSDRLPFIGSIEIKVDKDYFDWVKGEIK